MASLFYDLERRNYNLSDPLEGPRLQRVPLEFMEDVRNNVFQGPHGLELMDKFCTFISSKDVWHLAQMVVPEFRSAPESLLGR